MMQSDDAVGRVAAPTLVIMSKSLELFATELIGKAAALAAEDDTAKTLQPSHIKRCVESEDLFDFLCSTVDEVPAQAPKRARPAAASGAAKRGRPPKVSSATTAATSSEDAASGGSVPYAGEFRVDVDDDYDE